MSSNGDENERFFKKYQKEHKMERKQKSALDRSKYKKSDASKHQKKHIKHEEGTSMGRIIRIVSRGYCVAFEGKEYLASIKGSLKEQEHEDKNLATIGDVVHFIPIEGDLSTITSILPRKTALIRQDKIVKGKRQILAANVDQVFICASVVDPPLKPALIDRYIIAAEKGGIVPLVVINKCDLAADPAPLEEVKTAYDLAEIPCIVASTKSAEGLEEIKERMQGKISVFSGQSGVGKSSLINALLGTNLPVGLTTKEKKGSHTTTHPLLLPLPGGGYCVDTPGVKSFSIWAKSEDRIDHYYREIVRYSGGCKFRDCTHTHEEGCAVKQMVEQGHISPLRYASYCAILEEEEGTSRR